MILDSLGPSLTSALREPQSTPFVGNLAPLKPAPSEPSDFSAMLSGMMADAASTVQQAEATSLAAVHGNASIQQVAEAVLAAEMTLQGAIAVRDKITAAYLELSRMAI
jgi:flagellar hook-basal body complex protein FliE